MKTYTAAIVGTGRIGFTLGFDKKREQPASHTMALLANKRIRLVAGCDSNAESLEAWQRYVQKKQHSAVAAFTASRDMYAAMAASENTPDAPVSLSVPDIITVAVNEEAHVSECIAAIEAKPRLVILEKPVALNNAEAALIAESAHKNAVPVLVNHERRFAYDYRAARTYLHSIGDIQSIHAELLSGLRVYSTAEENSGAYSLLHDGTHLVDIVQFLLEELSADAGAGSAAVPDRAPLLQNPVLSGVFKDEKGDVRNVTARYSLPCCPEICISMSGRSRFFAFSVDVLGTTGRICVGNGFAKFYQRRESKLYTGFYSLTRDKNVRLPRKTGYFSNMVQNAVDFLDGRARLKSPLSVAIADLAVLEEIKAALQKA